MAKILLTSVFRPFGIENKYNKKGDELLLDYLLARLTREPGPFALSSYVPSCGIHLIAANVGEEVKVLDWPSEDEFIAEIKKGYDYVGISFLIKGFRKVSRMIALIRKYAPQAKIVLGGFGTSLYEVNELGADYVCRGEGVSFFRSLLNKPANESVTHPVITTSMNLSAFRHYPFLRPWSHRIGLITNGFGCPNACEFCSTSSYYGHTHIPFLPSGRALYETMREFNRENGVTDFLLFEEDFCLYQDHVREFGLLNSRDLEHMFTFGCFSSVKSLSQYDLEELVSFGLGHVWIGVESSYAPFEKREGRPIQEIFAELHAMGVATTGSIIFGLDHHTPANLTEDLNFLASLYPSTVQISNLMAAEGTPLRDRLQKEGRIKKVGFKEADLFSEIIYHPQFSENELPERVFQAYNTIYESIGPTLLRLMVTWFDGYKNLKKNSSAKLRKRGEICGRQARGLVPFFLETGQFLPNDDIRYRVKDLLPEIISELGEVTSKEAAFSRLIRDVFKVEVERNLVIPEDPLEPEPMVTEYSGKG